MRKLLYVAGPYTLDPVLCTRAAAIVGAEIYKHTEFVPIVPHLSLFWHMQTPMAYEDWLTIDLAVLARCHAITRLPGQSSGADREVEHALALGIPLIEFESFAQGIVNAYRGAVAALAL